MQSQVPAADRHLPCDTERPETFARVQQENPIDHIMLTLWCGWNAFLDSRQPGAAASPFKPRLMLGFWLALAAMWAIVGTVTLCIRIDWHSLTHQPEMVGKAFVHNFTVQVAYVWSSYKGHHRLRHLLPEIYAVLKLGCLVLPLRWCCMCCPYYVMCGLLPHLLFPLLCGVLCLEICFAGTKEMPNILLSFWFTSLYI